jgi:hypothetical protein
MLGRYPAVERMDNLDHPLLLFTRLQPLGGARANSLATVSPWIWPGEIGLARTGWIRQALEAGTSPILLKGYMILK